MDKHLFELKIVSMCKSFIWLMPVELREVSCKLHELLTWLKKYNDFSGSIEIYLIDDKTISHYNTIFLNHKGPTNVLSFPGIDEIPGILLLSLETYKREYILYNQPPVYYLFYLITHGIAHLAGLEHGSRFDIFQNRCLAFLNF